MSGMIKKTKSPGAGDSKETMLPFSKGTAGPSSYSMKAVGRNMARANNQKGGKK